MRLKLSIMSSKSTNNKRKGSAFEREIAKQLSLWIYNEPNIIRRHPTSGSEKDYGQGADISVFQPDQKELKIFIEVKCGYKQDLFNARKQILEWYEIALKKNKRKFPIWIIWKLLNRGIVLVSDKPLFEKLELYTVPPNLFVYDFKECLKNNFNFFV